MSLRIIGATMWFIGLFIAILIVGKAIPVVPFIAIEVMLVMVGIILFFHPHKSSTPEKNQKLKNSS